MVDSSNALIKTGLTGLIVVLAIPGLIIEPGPVSEIVALGSIGAVWGVDFDGAGSGE